MANGTDIVEGCSERYTPEVVKNLFSVFPAAEKGFMYGPNKDTCHLVQRNKIALESKRHYSV